ncbi:MAG: hypothetical protein ABF679_09895 [Lentilactobacillus diolivorans]|uniref:hypothetical protein n=1 Tax=Lentilactobacillus diolivorans TaxID=179838 RepID=UPI0039E97C0C
MKNTMKRSLFAGLAALSFVAVAGASTNASAAKKSYKIDFNQASSSSTATSRNYVPTGSNALYTKAGVLKSARKVADTSTLQNLANSKKGNDYFRGYRVAKLSNGSYYMKVVTFDKAYRGWIYVGKTDPRTNYKNVNAGLKYTDTTTDTTSSLTDAQKKATYQIQNPGALKLKPSKLLHTLNTRLAVTRLIPLTTRKIHSLSPKQLSGLVRVTNGFTLTMLRTLA